MSACCYINGVPEYVGQFRYEPPQWDDIRTPASAFQGRGINDPDFLLFQDDGVGSDGVFTWQFSNLVDQELFFWLQIPHSWREGTPIYPHIHWSPMTSGAGDVAWNIKYTVAKIGDPFPVTYEDLIFATAAGVALEHQFSFFSPIVMTGNLISTMIGCRLKRNATDWLGDTYEDLAALLEFDFHYQLNTPGSRQELLK